MRSGYCKYCVVRWGRVRTLNGKAADARSDIHFVRLHECIEVYLKRSLRRLNSIANIRHQDLGGFLRAGQISCTTRRIVETLRVEITTNVDQSARDGHGLLQRVLIIGKDGLQLIGLRIQRSDDGVENVQPRGPA